VAAVQGEVFEVGAEVPEDPEVLALTAPLRAATDTYLDTFATNLQTDLDARFARMEDTPLLQLLHQVQRQRTGAQLSAAACIDDRVYSVRQFYAMMPYENDLVRVRLSGEQVRKYLEQAARYYNYSHLPELTTKGFGGFNYDMVDGVTYTLDISRNPGERVGNLRYNGQPVRPDQMFTLAMTTYRFHGGGGYKAAVGWGDTPEAVFQGGLRNDLLAYVLARPALTLAPARNWRLIPSIDRERVLRLRR
jgi:2',3'-cyclic-nucleotide 2'-phosphodiesterase/3'-nucleotidase